MRAARLGGARRRRSSRWPGTGCRRPDEVAPRRPKSRAMLVIGAGHGRQSRPATRTEELTVALAPARHGGRWQRSSGRFCASGIGERQRSLEPVAPVAPLRGHGRHSAIAGIAVVEPLEPAVAPGEHGPHRTRRTIRRRSGCPTWSRLAAVDPSRRSRGRGTDRTRTAQVPVCPVAPVPAGHWQPWTWRPCRRPPRSMRARAVVACRARRAHDDARAGDRGCCVRHRRGSRSAREDWNRRRHERREQPPHRPSWSELVTALRVAALAAKLAIRRRCARRRASMSNGTGAPVRDACLEPARVSRRSAAASRVAPATTSTRTIDHASAKRDRRHEEARRSSPSVGWLVLVAHSHAPRSSPARTAVAPSGPSGIASEASPRSGRHRGRRRNLRASPGHRERPAPSACARPACAAPRRTILWSDGLRAKCCGCTEAFQASRAGSIPVARLHEATGSGAVW